MDELLEIRNREKVFGNRAKEAFEAFGEGLAQIADQLTEGDLDNSASGLSIIRKNNPINTEQFIVGFKFCGYNGDQIGRYVLIDQSGR